MLKFAFGNGRKGRMGKIALTFSDWHVDRTDGIRKNETSPSSFSASADALAVNDLHRLLEDFVTDDVRDASGAWSWGDGLCMLQPGSWKRRLHECDTPTGQNNGPCCRTQLATDARKYVRARVYGVEGCVRALWVHWRLCPR